MLTYQEKVSFLVGRQSDKITLDYLAKTLAIVSAKIYANQFEEYFSGYKSGEYLSAPKWGSAKRERFTPLTKGDFSHLIQGLIGVTTRDRIEFLQSIKGKIIEFFESIKKECCRNSDGYHLRLLLNVGYSDQALAKSSVRIGVLNMYKATPDAPSVFFCVHAYAYPRFAVLYRSESMVAAAEQPKGWLVPLYASNANSIVVTTLEIGVSSGDSLAQYKEIIVMMATPTQTQFNFLFLSIKRSDTTAQPCRITITASNEHDARLMLVRDYILAFAGRVPVQGVTA